MHRPSSSHRRTAPRHPVTEVLEDCRLLAVITGNTASEASDQTGATPSLRQALAISNGALAVTVPGTQQRRRSG